MVVISIVIEIINQLITVGAPPCMTFGPSIRPFHGTNNHCAPVVGETMSGGTWLRLWPEERPFENVLFVGGPSVHYFVSLPESYLYI